nr:MAG TPA: hypothetical protein [Bacteriophage sp.]
MQPMYLWIHRLIFFIDTRQKFRNMVEYRYMG